jgi:hypothetical protein
MRGIADQLGSKIDFVEFCLLNSFDTQQQFISLIKEFLNASPAQAETKQKRLLLIQCDLSDKYSSQSFDLISCARHSVIEICKQKLSSIDNCYIVLLLNLQHDNIKLFSGK